MREILRGYQVLVILLACIIFLWAIKRYKQGKSEGRDLLLWIIISSGIAGIGAFPDLLNIFMSLLESQVRINTAFMISISLLFLILYYLYDKVIDLNKKLTEMVRAHAIIRYQVEGTQLDAKIATRDDKT